MQSKVGEPLKAEIDIADLSSAEQQDLQAQIATPELYKSSHLELPSSGGRPLELQVQLLKRDNGRYFLRVSSQQAVTSRSLDLLLQMRWASGQSLRDISLSLDDAAVAKPSASPLPASAPAVKATASDKLEVQRGDTASEIVVRDMPKGVSLDQMLLALLRNNPDAFVDSNVNRLKAGALLTLPSAEQAKEISRAEAREEIQFQTQNFNAYRAELAARAGTGSVPKAERSSGGKLQAQVQNKASKPNQDKLTLSKPKDAKGEDKIAQQRQAQEVADRAAELSRNVSELGQLAAAAASAAGEGVALPTPPEAATQEDWLSQLTQHTLAPVGAGLLIALMVIFGLLRRQQRHDDDEEIQGLPPLNVKFDLDLPQYDETARASTESPAHPTEAHSPHFDNAPEPMAAPAARPTMDIPDISLDLGDANHHPFQVRMDLAEELWKLGQLHTSRALMEEVAHEATGEVQTKALQWLADRS